MANPPSCADGWALTLFVVFITFDPFFMNREINIFETGLYLPGVQAVLHGEVPFRDVFHLRGPLELYVPALMMKMFGAHLTVLYSYFYIGNVLCLILCVWLAREFLTTRLMMYLAIPVLVARAYPRVVFAYWGGLRYALGLLAALFVIRWIKRQQPSWMIWAGVATICGLLVSVEIGAYVIIGFLATLLVSWLGRIQNRPAAVKAFGFYSLGILAIAIPFGFYLAGQGALKAYGDAVWTVVTRMQDTFDPHLVSIYPRNFTDALVAMTNVLHTNFKQMTPSYLYLALAGLLIWRWRRKNFGAAELSLLFLGLYGFIMYNTGFRGIWAAQFEMALMPEKILWFYVLEVVALALLAHGRMPPAGRAAYWAKVAGQLFLIGLIVSSVGYSLSRYNHRFMVFKIASDVLKGKGAGHAQPMARTESRILTIERARGLRVPTAQAEELEAVNDYFQKHSSPDDIVFTYPELGGYNFFIDRPFLGRFPIATFSWMNNAWHRELVRDLRTQPVKYVILQKTMPEDWYQVYLGTRDNRQKYNEMMALIHSQFVLEAETPLSYIYASKSYAP